MTMAFSMVYDLEKRVYIGQYISIKIHYYIWNRVATKMFTLIAIGLGTLITGLTAGITYWATKASGSKMETGNKIETSGAINNIVVTDIQD